MKKSERSDILDEGDRMPREYKFTNEQYDEVMNLLQTIKDAKLHKKLEVLQLRMEGYKYSEIAAITKYSASRASALVCIYAHDGISYFETEHRVGGNRRNISFEEESAMLAEFKEAARTGQIVSVSDIKSVFNEKSGHESGSGTIYTVLKRHGWRKVMPRSKHPKKASDEAIAASKKLTLESKK
jgi:transposase